MRQIAQNDTGGEWGSQLRRGVLELCILSLIERSPAYGYEVVTAIAGVPQLASGEGTIYPLLRRLKKDGLVATFWRESDAGPPRQYYELTPQGAEALRMMKNDWRALVAAMNGYLSRGAE
jgi:PadR family transcriptional regulator PadR